MPAQRSDPDWRLRAPRRCRTVDPCRQTSHKWRPKSQPTTSSTRAAAESVPKCDPNTLTARIRVDTGGEVGLTRVTAGRRRMSEWSAARGGAAGDPGDSSDWSEGRHRGQRLPSRLMVQTTVIRCRRVRRTRPRLVDRPASAGFRRQRRRSVPRAGRHFTSSRIADVPRLTVDRPSCSESAGCALRERKAGGASTSDPPRTAPPTLSSTCSSSVTPFQSEAATGPPTS